MTLLAQLKAEKRYFRRPRLTISELVQSCHEVWCHRLKIGQPCSSVDVFLSLKDATKCIRAVSRLTGLNMGTPIIGQFGFAWQIWKVNENLTINFITHRDSGSNGLVYVLDFTAIYADKKRGEFTIHKNPKAQAVFGCVKSFCAK